MKKKYVTLQMRVVEMKQSLLLVGSGLYGTINGSNNLRYGGIDNEGEDDPD